MDLKASDINILNTSILTQKEQKQKSMLVQEDSWDTLKGYAS